MSAPVPVDGANPYTGTYQTKHFDCAWPPSESALHALNTAPGVLPSTGGAITQQASPSKAFAARDYQNVRENTKSAAGIP